MPAFPCPNCSHLISAPDSTIGFNAHCPNCGATCQVDGNTGTDTYAASKPAIFNPNDKASNGEGG